MVQIVERVLKDGKKSYKVILRKENVAYVSVTFRTYKGACNWAEKYEPIFLEDPKAFKGAVDEMRKEMIRERTYEVDDMRRPRRRIR